MFDIIDRVFVNQLYKTINNNGTL